MTDDTPKPPRSPADERRAERFRERRALAAKMNTRPALSAKAIHFAELMVFDGADWQTAARAAGISLKAAKTMLGSPMFARELARRTEELRNALCASNPHALARLRDKGLAEDASAADGRNAIEAVKVLERRDERPSVTFNGPVLNLMPGYSIDLSGPAAGPRQIEQRGPFDRREAIDVESFAPEKSGEDPER